MSNLSIISETGKDVATQINNFIVQEKTFKSTT